MQPVDTAPGLAFVSERTAEPPEFDAMTTVPAAKEFDGLVAVALRFDQVAALARTAHPMSTAIVLHRSPCFYKPIAAGLSQNIDVSNWCRKKASNFPIRP